MSNTRKIQFTDYYNLILPKLFYVYKITNSKNIKIYIGKSNTYYNRWNEHKKTAKSESCLDCSSIYSIEFFKIKTEQKSNELIKCIEPSLEIKENEKLCIKCNTIQNINNFKLRTDSNKNYRRGACNTCRLSYFKEFDSKRNRKNVNKLEESLLNKYN